MDWLKLVTQAREEKSFDKAVALLNAELVKRPTDPMIHYQMAWTHDALGKEKDAVPAYESAIAFGLKGEDLKGAYLGLGSTYRTLGEYEKSNDVFVKAIAEFPDYAPLKTFWSLTLFNLGKSQQSMEILLQQLVETTSDSSIKSYQKALLFYSDKLDEIFE